MASAPRPPLLQRLFIRDGKLHPAWRCVLYFFVAFVGSGIVQSMVVVLYIVLVALLTRVDMTNFSAQLAVGDIPTPLLAVITIVGFVWTIVGTWAFRRWLDKASLTSLGFAWQGLGRETAAGLGWALLSMLLILGAHLALNWATVSVNASGAQIPLTLGLMLLVLYPAAAIEEILFRGYLLQNLEGWLGWWPSVVVSSTLFGLAHFSNPAFGWLPLLNITLAGVAFAVMYRLTRRLWFVMAYHFMWNYAQGPLFGFPVSGLAFDTLLKTDTHGPPLWTGGAFGPEGGLLVTMILVLLTLAFVFWERRTADKSEQITNDRRQMTDSHL